jgi:Na+-transporting NADH:ubiquinone oxidoreductase subunit NqrC
MNTIKVTPLCRSITPINQLTVFLALVIKKTIILSSAMVVLASTRQEEKEEAKTSLTIALQRIIQCRVLSSSA